MRRALLQLTLACFVLLSQARGTLLTIANSDFETGGVADGASSNSPGVTPTGWTLVNNGTATGSFYGYFNPLNGTYLNTTGLPGSPASMSGPNVFYFGTLSDQQGISQVLNTGFDNSTTYVLTLAVGTRLAYANMTNLSMSLYAGSTLITSSTLLASNYATAATAGTFNDYSLTYVAGTQNLSALQGQLLKLVFLQSGTGLEVDIDNVRLDAIPEPSPWAFGALALTFGLFLLRRHARPRATS